MNYFYAKLTSRLPQSDLKNKRVLLRADCNVPISKGLIKNDFRLRALLPTLRFIIEKKGRIVIATHLGRPKKQEPEFSTRQLIPWFEKNNLHLEFAQTIDEAKKSTAQIVLLENLRFFAGELNNDADFAKALASCGDYYVCDAFGTVHRNHASLTQTPLYFSPQYRTIGFLIEREIKALNKLLDNPAQPFLVLLGGNKIETKLPLIKSLLEQDASIFLLPALVFTFLAAQNKEAGKSLIDENELAAAKKLLDDKKTKEKLLFPIDYLIADNDANGQLSFFKADTFPADGYGISVGPETVSLVTQKIASARSIFFNAAVGFKERPETLLPINKILSALAQSNAYTVIGGGDSVEYAFDAGVAEQIKFLSTGGGAALAYLSKADLPGLDPFITQSGKS
ncbi:MAG TPA: phosphoglycerate kinase [Candidatus Babeliales bacterium]|nr:phosphoglycerate kinase [Candidatus Babeliales bacterium]